MYRNLNYQHIILKIECGIYEHVKPTLLSDVLQARKRVKVSQLRVIRLIRGLLTGSGLEGCMGDDSAFLDPYRCSLAGPDAKDE